MNWHYVLLKLTYQYLLQNITPSQMPEAAQNFLALMLVQAGSTKEVEVSPLILASQNTLCSI